jgi:hypothetical protein
MKGDPMSTAGVIIYRINQDGSLDGRWTHPELKGMTGTERATGGTPGKWEGVYDAEIYVGGQEAIFRGSLEIRPMGAAYTLNWVGTQIPPSGNSSTYTGIGLVEADNVLVAAFQESAPPSG